MNIILEESDIAPTENELAREVTRLKQRISELESGSGCVEAGAPAAAWPATEIARDNPRLFAEIVEHTPVPIAYFDRDQNLVFVNPKFRQELGRISDVLVPGVSYEACVRTYAERGLAVLGDLTVDEWVAERIRILDCLETQEIRILGDRWMVVTPHQIADGGFVVIAYDITDLRRGESVRRSMSEAEQVANIGHWSYDLATKKFVMSDEAHRILGLPVGAQIGMEESLKNVVPEDREFVMRATRNAIKRRQGFSKEIYVNTPSGHHRYVQIVASLETDQSGLVTTFHGVLQDISARRAAEIAASENEERFKAIVSNTDEAIVSIAADGSIESFNPAAEHMFGYAAGDVLGNHVSILEPPEDRESIRNNLNGPSDTAVRAANQRRDRESLRKDGTCFPSVIRVSAMEVGGERKFFALIRDVSEERKAEADRRESEERFRASFEEAGIGMTVTQPDGRFLMVNNAFREMFGYSKDAFLKMSIYDVCHPEDHPTTRNERADIVAGGSPRRDVEKRYLRKDGTVMWGVLNRAVVRSPDGSVKCIIGHVQDVTERKNFEIALRASERRFKDYAESAADRFWETDENHRFVYVSPPTSATHKLSGDYVLGKTRWEWAAADQNETPWREHFADLNAHRPFRDFRYARSDGKGGLVHIRVNGTPIFDETGKFTGYRGTTIDETAQIEADNRAAAVQTQFFNAMERAPEGIMLWDADDRMVHCNARYRELYSFVDDLLVPGVAFQELLRAQIMSGHFPAFKGKEENWLKKRFSHQEDRDVSFNWVDKDGRSIQIEKRILPDGSKIAFHTDITAAIKAESAIRESEQRFRESFDSTRVPMAMIGPDGAFMRVNGAFAKFVGYSKKELQTIPARDLAHPDDRKKVKDATKNQFGGPSWSKNNEHRYIHKSGQVIWGQVSATVIRNAEGEPVYSVVHVLDVTARRKAEEAIRDSEQRFRMSFNESRVAMAMVSRTGTFLNVNQAFAKLLGYSKKELLEMTPAAHIHADDRAENNRLRTQLFSGRRRSYSIENRYIHKNGSIVWGQVHATMIRDAAGNPLYLIGHLLDVTARKRSDEVLKSNNEILSQVAAGKPLDDLLTRIAQSVERLNPDMMCSIMLFDKDNNCLRSGVAPSLPDFYVDAIDGITVGDTVGSCGAAAYQKKRVIAEDVQSHPNWTPYRALAKRAGVRACWSQPVLSSDGDVLGTVAIYYRNPRKPKRADLEYIDSVAWLAGIAIERDKLEAEIRSAAEKVSATVGERYFQSLVAYMTDALGVDHAVVGKIVGDNGQKIETIAVHSNGQPADNFAYDLPGTPCENVASKCAAIYETGIQQLFPDDQLLIDMGIDGYAGAPLRDSMGRPLGVLVVLTNDKMKRPQMVYSLLQIFAGRAAAELERKGVEDALRESEARFKDFAYSTADRFWETDKNHRLTYVSTSGVSRTAKSTERIISHPIWEQEGVDIEGERLRQHRQMLEKRLPFRDFRFTQVDKEGKVQFLRSSGTPIFDVAGNFCGYRGTTVNETDEIEAQKIAEDSHQRFLNALEMVPDGVILWDADNRFVMCNTNYRQMSLSAEILETGMPFEDYIRGRAEVGCYPTDRFEKDEWVNYRLDTFKKDSYEAEIQHGEKWFRGRSRRLTDGSNIIFLNDITAIKRREEELRQAQKMEAVGNLTGGVAHDFNNILAAILGNLELVHESTPEGPTSHRLERAINAVQKGGELTKRLLAFSRKQTLQPVPTNLNKLVGDLIDMLRRTLGEQVEIKTSLAAHIWPTLVDQNQLENALVNLAINARDAMPGGGTLNFECANFTLSEADAKRFKEMRPGDYVSLTVRDSGTGIAAENLERVFDPFFTTKDVGQGSGLGLSMVYGFVKQSGGDVEIQSAVEEGTAVTIFLPRTDAAKTEEGSLGGQAPIPRGNGERVLIVEDDPDVRDVTIGILTGLGYETLDGEDGSDPKKIDCSEIGDVDLVLTDVVLPGGRNGPDIAEGIQSKCPAAKVLLMTGYAENDVVLSDGTHLRFPLINKPFETADLARKIRETLAGLGHA